MTDLQIKLKLIFVRFLLIYGCYIGVYSFLNWYFVLDKHLLHWDEEYTNFLLPLILAFIPVLVWLMPRIKLLMFDTSGRKNPVGAYVILAGFAIGGTTAMAQLYVTTATGKLTQLPSVESINGQPLTKYYALQKHFVSKKLHKSYRTYGTSGKHNQYLDWNLYIACPIFADSVPYKIKLSGSVGYTDTGALAAKYPIVRKALILLDGNRVSFASLAMIDPIRVGNVQIYQPAAAMQKFGTLAAGGAMVITLRKVVTVTPKAWLCLSYRKSVSNNLTQAEKDTLHNQFIKDSYSDFYRRNNLDSFTYLDRIGENKRHGWFIKAISYNNASFGAAPIVLEPVYTPFAARNGNMLYWTLGVFATASLIFYVMLLRPELNHNKVNNLLSPDPGGWESTYKS